MHALIDVLRSAWETFAADLVGSLPAVAIVGAVFTGIGLVARPCNAGPPWWRKPDLLTDLCYVTVLPSLIRYGSIGCMITGLALIHGTTDVAAAVETLNAGQGPLSRIPFAGQIALYLVLSDLFLYATHRAFHSLALWRYHAIHHSSEQLEWISSHRFHPFDLFWHSVFGDCVLLLMGISPDVLVWLAPFSLGTSALAHANLDWTFGPLRYLLVSPVYHRWHHTGVDEGGSSNFAATFPIFDLAFGTCYLPSGALPQRFGVTERDVPADFGGQMLHPFRRARVALPPPTPEEVGLRAEGVGA